MKDSDASHSWATYKSTINAFNARNTGVVTLGGFEMTWSGGPGHINTWVTPAWFPEQHHSEQQDRRCGHEGLLRAAVPAGRRGLHQPVQPSRSTFGTFKDFSYWDPVIDSRMYLVEVGNGEGQIGAGGYYPSYEQYIVALDRAGTLPPQQPGQPQGPLGQRHDARDVILAESCPRDALYEGPSGPCGSTHRGQEPEITYRQRQSSWVPSSPRSRRT